PRRCEEARTLLAEDARGGRRQSNRGTHPRRSQGLPHPRSAQPRAFPRPRDFVAGPGAGLRRPAFHGAFRRGQASFSGSPPGPIRRGTARKPQNQGWTCEAHFEGGGQGPAAGGALGPADGGLHHAGQRMADRKPQGLRTVHAHPLAPGPARPFQGRCGPTDAGGALFGYRQPGKPDLELVDAAALVGGVRPLTVLGASLPAKRVLGILSGNGSIALNRPGRYGACHLEEGRGDTRDNSWDRILLCSRGISTTTFGASSL